jgi:hypothetical protein
VGVTSTYTFTVTNAALRLSTDNFNPTSNSAALQCYPNPSSGLFHISVPVNDDSFGSAFIYDVHGNLINTLFEGQVQSGSNLDLQWQTIKSGIYFLKTKIGEQEYCQKLIAY